MTRRPEVFVVGTFSLISLVAWPFAMVQLIYERISQVYPSTIDKYGSVFIGFCGQVECD